MMAIEVVVTGGIGADRPGEGALPRAVDLGPIEQQTCAFSSIALTSPLYSFSVESGWLLNSWGSNCRSMREPLDGRRARRKERGWAPPTATFKSHGKA